MTSISREKVEILIARLRCEADSVPNETTSASWVSDLCSNTAETLTALLARLSEAEKALEPFANAVYNDNGDVTYDTRCSADDLWQAYDYFRRTRRARAALAEKP